MSMSTVNLSYTLPGAVLPSIHYVDALGNPQVLLFRMPPTNVSPVAPVPVRNDNVAGDGTMWSVLQYVEAYMEMEVLCLIGDDVANWIAFLSAAVNGQVLTFYPDQSVGSYSVQVRLMVQGTSGASNTNVPRGDPQLKRAGVGRFKAQLVFRYETPSDAAVCFQKLNNW